MEGHDGGVRHVLELVVLRLQRRQPHPVRLHQRLAGVQLDRKHEPELDQEIGQLNTYTGWIVYGANDEGLPKAAFCWFLVLVKGIFKNSTLP